MTSQRTFPRKTFLSMLAVGGVSAFGCGADGEGGGTGGVTAGGGSSGGGVATAGDSSFGGSAGAGGTSGSTMTCSADTDNGDHSHPLTIPQEDLDTYTQPSPWELEDGGTGHTHSLTLTAYDLLSLQPGVTYEVESSENSGHTHVCVITCSMI